MTDGAHRRGLLKMVDILAILGVFFISSVVVATFLGLVTAVDSSKELRFLIAYVVSMVITICFGWWLYRRREGGNLSISFSFRSVDPVLLLWGIVFMVAVSIVLEPLLALFPSQWLDAVKNVMGDGRSVWTALSVIVAAPILEEILFRGVVQGISVRRFGALRGILISSLIFGVAHVNVPQQALNAFVIALILGYVYYKTGSLSSSILLHAANNMIAYLMVLAGHSDTMLKDIITNSTIFWIIYVICAVIAVYSFYHFYRALGDVAIRNERQQ